MPAKKNNENQLYIKQKYRPDYNNNLALRTQSTSRHNHTLRAISTHMT